MYDSHILFQNLLSHPGIPEVTLCFCTGSWIMYDSHILFQNLLSHPGIPGVTLCFCTGSYAAAAAAAGRRFLLMR